MKRIVISEFMAETALEDLRGGFSVEYDRQLYKNRLLFLDSLKDADGLIVRNQTKVDKDALQAAPKLKVIGRLGVGLDNIDIEECKRRKISVCPATGANANAVAEYVIGAALMLQRKAFDFKQSMIVGDWPRMLLGMGQEIAGSTMGFIGFGNIAQTVAFRAQALGMETIAFDPHLAPNNKGWAKTERVKFNQVLERSDILSLHVPFTDQTRDMINSTTLKQMKPGAILINTSRGGVVDEEALVFALNKNHLAGAALDVFKHEPLSFKKAAMFKDCPNLILTPHIAGLTMQSNERVANLTVQNVKKYI